MTIRDILLLDKTRSLNIVLIHTNRGTYSCNISELTYDKLDLPVKYFQHDILRGSTAIEFTVDENISETNLFPNIVKEPMRLGQLLEVTGGNTIISIEEQFKLKHTYWEGNVDTWLVARPYENYYVYNQSVTVTKDKDSTLYIQIGEQNPSLPCIEVDNPTPGLKLIPNWQTKSNKCYKCGTTRSVKYLMTFKENVSPANFAEICLCNLCAATFDRTSYVEITTAQEGLHIRNAISEIEQALDTIHDETTTANYLTSALKLLRAVRDTCYTKK